MKKTEDSLRRYKKGKKSTFSLFGTSSASAAAQAEEESRDEARIRAQMVMDVDTLAKDAASLGGGGLVDVDGSAELEELKALAAVQGGDGSI